MSDPYQHLHARLSALLPPTSTDGKCVSVPPEGSCALLAAGADRVYTWDETDATLRAIKLSRNANEAVEILACVMEGSGKELDHLVYQLMINESGTYMALIGDGDISVVHLPEDRGPKYGSGLQGYIAEPTQCHTRSVGSVHNTSGVLQACWHPLSSDCLVVLTNDGKLRFYDVLSPKLGHPGMELSVGPDRSKVFIGLGAGEGVVAFDFGSRGGWDIFTIFLLGESGDVTYLCPVVPRGCVVPASALPELRQNLNNISMPLECWFDEINPKRIKEDSTLSSEVPHLLLLEQPTSTMVQPLLQGPLCISSDDHDDGIDGDDSASLIVLTSKPTVMVTADVGGLIQISILTEPIQPAWKTADDRKKVVQTASVVEKIKLELTGAGRTVKLLKDPIFTNQRFYAYHNQGIHSIRAGYLAAVQQSFEQPEIDVQMPSVFASQVEYMLITVSNTSATSEGNAIVGMLVLADPRGGYHWAAMTQNMHVEADALSRIDGLFDDSASSDFTLANTSVNNTAKREDFRQTIKSILKNSAEYPLTSSGNDLDLVKLSAMLKDTVSDMRQNQIRPMTVAHHKIDQKREEQRRLSEVQAQKLAELEKEIDTIRTTNETLKHERKSVQNYMTDLVQYMQDMVSHYNSVMHVTSDAEIKYRKEIVALDTETRQIDRCCRQFNAKYQRAEKSGMLASGAPKPSASIHMDDEQKEHMRQSLLDLNSNMGNLVEKTLNLTADMGV